MHASLFIVLITLYISQGLPSGILAHVLPALMADEGVAPHYIGMLKLLALPWALKFLWAPYVDRFGLSFLGPHRTWILLMQSALIVLFVLAALSSQSVLFGSMLIPFLICIVLVNTTAATQDIATDGLAVRLLPEKLRGLGNSVQVAGYKVGMILSSSLILMSISYFGWQSSLLGMSFILFMLMLPVMFLVSKANRVSDQDESTKEPHTPLKVYLGFFKQPTIRLWLIVLLTYKLADSFGSVMIKPLLVDIGFDLEAIAGLTFWSSIVGLVGAAFGGWVYYKIGSALTMLFAGLGQALAIGAYYFVAQASVDGVVIYVIALTEQFVDGASTVALFALMMGQCRQHHEGADYTIQASIQVFMSGVAAAIGGVIASVMSFSSVYVFAACVGLLSLMPVYLFSRTQAREVCQTKEIQQNV